MFSKFSNIIKQRSIAASDDDTVSKTDVAGRVKELHPNMSIFQPDASEVPFPTPSPPASPSKTGRSGMMKRMSRMPYNDSAESLPKFGLSKKVKSSLANLAIGELQHKVSTTLRSTI